MWTKLAMSALAGCSVAVAFYLDQSYSRQLQHMRTRAASGLCGAVDIDKTFFWYRCGANTSAVIYNDTDLILEDMRKAHGKPKH